MIRQGDALFWTFLSKKNRVAKSIFNCSEAQFLMASAGVNGLNEVNSAQRVEILTVQVLKVESLAVKTRKVECAD